MIDVLAGNSFSLRGLVNSCILNNYFVVLYVVLYLISPYINMVICRLDRKQWKQMLIIMLFLFSIYPTGIDVMGEIVGIEIIGLSSIGLYGSQGGYTIINFMLMYILGAYICIVKKEEREDKIRLILLILICGVSCTLWGRINDIVGYFTEKSAWEYCNPMVILIAVLIFKLFNSFSKKTIRSINVMSKGAFSVFLFQNEIMSYLPMEEIMKGNELSVLVKLLLVAMVIYIGGWLIGTVYTKLEVYFKNLLIKNTKIFELEYPQ